MLNFKEKNKDKLINKLAENPDKINISNLYFWFDIAKDFHYLTVILEIDWETTEYDLWIITNNTEWFINFTDFIEELQELWVLNNHIYIWLEATGSYYFSLIGLINKLDIKQLYVINPLKINKFKSALTTSKTKNDKVDSELIWEYMYTYRQYLEKTDTTNQKQSKNIIHQTRYLEISNLRLMYRQIHNEKQELVKLKNKIKDLTNRIFPELEEVFNPRSYSKLENYVKSNFTRQEILKLTKLEFYKQVMKWVNSKEFEKKQYKLQLEKLHELLTNWIWIDDTTWYFKYQMKTFINKFTYLTQNIDTLNELITLELERNNLFIPKIKGITPNFLWIFYSELWNMIEHKTLKQLIGYVWWYPVEKSSWWKDLAKPRLKQWWNYLLRHYIYLAAMNFCNHNEVWKQYKALLKRKHNKTWKEIYIKIWNKLFEVIISLMRSWKDFDTDLFHTQTILPLLQKEMIREENLK